jgi:hypothetical protein
MDGMTGKIGLDDSGRRTRFKLHVAQYFMGKFKKVGWWQTGQGVTRTQSDTEKDAEIEESLRSTKLIVSSRIVSCIAQSHSHATTTAGRR